MQDDVWTPRRTPAPAARRRPEAEEAPGFDLSFTQLTLFFVKASLAAALALTVTSVVWMGLATLLAGVGAGIYLAYDASRSVEAAPVSTVAAVLAAPPPAPEPIALAPMEIVVDRPAARPERAPRKRAVEASDAATDRLIRAEIEAMRARRR